MKAKTLSRREFLRLLGLSSAALALSGCRADSSARVPFGTATPAGETPDVEIVLRAVSDSVQLFEGQETAVWRYRGEVLAGPEDALIDLPGSYLGPIFNVKTGQHVRVHFSNELAEPSIVHWHGLHVPVTADGHPRLAIDPGESYQYDFVVADRAGTYWYHPHPHGRTGPQVYAGMAGLFIVHDDEELALGLPSGEYDLPIVIQDRVFDGENQLIYGSSGMMGQMMGFLGNEVLINGSPDFEMAVASRPYRLRLLNGSNSRIYKLAWDDGSLFTVIGTDGGLLAHPIEKESITLAPAQRVELWVDFSGDEIGTTKNLVSLPFGVYGGEVEFPLFSVTVDREETFSESLPEVLTPLEMRSEADAVNQADPKEIELAMTPGMGWALNGKTFEMEAVSQDEIVRLGDLEVWEFVNSGERGMGMGMMGGMILPHPMHVHGLQFQILSREVSSEMQFIWESLSDGFVDEGWHDTVLVMPGERVKILLKFEDFTGLYLYHCHNLEHEDMGMMRNYRVDA